MHPGEPVRRWHEVKRLEVQIALLPILSGEIHISRLTVLNPEFLIEIDKSGKSNLEFDVPQKPEPKPAEDEPVDGKQDFLKFKEVQIKDGAFTYNDLRSGKTEAISIENLRLKSPEFGAPVDIDLKFTYNKTPFQIAGDFGQLSGILNSEEQWPLNLTITALGATVSIAGHITNIMEVQGIDLKLAVKGPDIANFQQVTGEPLPIKGPFDVAGHLTAATLENLKISDIAVLLGESRISGEIALNQKSPRPQIDAKFHSQKLDLRPFIKQEQSDSKTETKPRRAIRKATKYLSAEPFDLQALQQVDAVVSFRADQILAHRIALDKFQYRLKLKKWPLNH